MPDGRGTSEVAVQHNYLATENLTNPRAWYNTKGTRLFTSSYHGGSKESASLETSIAGTQENQGMTEVDPARNPEHRKLPLIQERQTVDTDKADITGDHPDEKLVRDPLPQLVQDEPVPEHLSRKLNYPLSEGINLPVIKAHRSEKRLPEGHCEHDPCMMEKLNELRIPQHEKYTKEMDTFRDTYLLRQKSILKFKTDLAGGKENMRKDESPMGIQANMKRKRTILDYLRSISPQYRKHKGSGDIDGTFKPIEDRSSRNQDRGLEIGSVTPFSGRRKDQRHSSKSNKENRDKNISYSSKMTQSPREKLSGNTKTSVVNLSISNREDKPPKSVTFAHSTSSILSSRNQPLDSSLSVDNSSASRIHPEDGDDLQSELSLPTSEKAQNKMFLRKFKKLEVFAERKRPETSHRGRYMMESPERMQNIPVLRPPQYRLDLKTPIDAWRSLHSTQESEISIPKNVRQQYINHTANSIILDPPATDVSHTGTYKKGLASRKTLKPDKKIREKTKTGINDEDQFEVLWVNSEQQDTFPNTQEGYLNNGSAKSSMLSETKNYVPPNTVDNTALLRDNLAKSDSATNNIQTKSDCESTDINSKDNAHDETATQEAEQSSSSQNTKHNLEATNMENHKVLAHTDVIQKAQSETGKSNSSEEPNRDTLVS